MRLRCFGASFSRRCSATVTGTHNVRPVVRCERQAEAVADLRVVAVGIAAANGSHVPACHPSLTDCYQALPRFHALPRALQPCPSPTAHARAAIAPLRRVARCAPSYSRTHVCTLLQAPAAFLFKLILVRFNPCSKQ